MSSSALRGSTNVTLHTHFANRAINGRMEKEGISAIPSLFQFNAQANIVFTACQHDDPLAWWVLIKIEMKLEKIEENLTEMMAKANEALSVNSDRIEIEETHSQEPENHVVNVSNYGFKMLDMISLYDRFCCRCMGAVHRCRLPQDIGNEMMNQGASLLRKGMAVPHGYAYTGVTRKDLKEKNQRAIKAIERLTKSRIIDMTQFKDLDDVCSYFANYQPESTYGPNIIKLGAMEGKK